MCKYKQRKPSACDSVNIYQTELQQQQYRQRVTLPKSIKRKPNKASHYLVISSMLSHFSFFCRFVFTFWIFFFRSLFVWCSYFIASNLTEIYLLAFHCRIFANSNAYKQAILLAGFQQCGTARRNIWQKIYWSCSNKSKRPQKQQSIKWSTNREETERNEEE